MEWTVTRFRSTPINNNTTKPKQNRTKNEKDGMFQSSIPVPYVLYCAYRYISRTVLFGLLLCRIMCMFYVLCMYVDFVQDLRGAVVPYVVHAHSDRFSYGTAVAVLTSTVPGTYGTTVLR